MGLMDVILGRRKLAKPADDDRLFAMSTAYVTIEAKLGLQSRGAAAIVFQPLDTADFKQIVEEMVAVVKGVSADSGTELETHDDDYGFRWMVLRDSDFDDLVVGINTVSSAIEAGGYGERVLCAVFAMQDSSQRGVYWIYNYKRARFYPFAPAAGQQQRDTERELRLKAQIGHELPLEPEISRWFPLWGIPI